MEPALKYLPQARRLILSVCRSNWRFRGIVRCTVFLAAVTSALILTPSAFSQTQPASEADKIDYYYAKKDWKSLIKMGKPAIPRLTGALNDADRSVRYWTMFAICWADKANLPALKPLTDVLVSAMNNDESVNNRHQAAEALEKLEYQPKDVESILRFLLAFADFRGDSDPRVYRDFEADFDRGNFAEAAAGRKLAAMKDGNTKILCDILKDLLSKGHNSEAVFAAVTLGVWGDKAATDTLISISNCSDRAGSGYTNVAPRCPLTAVSIVALGRLDDPNSVDRIVDHIDMLLKSKDVLPDIILASAVALERIHDKRAIKSLGGILGRSDIRHWPYEYTWPERVCRALASFGPDSLDTLAIGLEKNSVPRKSVILALGRIRDERSVAMLVEELPSGMKEIPEALGNLGYKSAVPALCEAFQKPTAEQAFRIATLRALAKLGDKAAIDAVRKGLTDPDSYIREEAARTLEQLGWKP